MDGDNLNENKRVYAQLGSPDDVKRVWEVCESDPQLHECMNIIDMFRKIYKIKEAEAMFDKMSKQWKQLSAKHYTAMLKVYVDHKLLNKGKNVVNRWMRVGVELGLIVWMCLLSFIQK